MRPQLDDRASLRRPRRGLAARRPRERRPRRQGRLRDSRAGLPAQRAGVARRRVAGRSRPRGWRASTARCRTAWTRATTASSSATWAAASAGISPLPCAAPASTPRSSASPTRPRCAPRARPARARSACRTSSSGAASPDSWRTRRRELAGRRALFLSAGNGFQACRANLFPFTEQVALERLGLGDTRGGGRLQSGDRQRAHDAAGVDRAGGRRPAQHDALLPPRHRARARRLGRAVRRVLGPARGDARTGRGRMPDSPATWPRPSASAARSRRCSRRPRGAFASSRSTAARAADLRDVYLCGDLYLRVDEWGNDDLQRKLADHGLRPIFEPYGAFFELLQLRQIQDGVPLRKLPEKEATLAHDAVRRPPAARGRCARSIRGPSGTTCATSTARAGVSSRRIRSARRSPRSAAPCSPGARSRSTAWSRWRREGAGRL